MIKNEGTMKGLKQAGIVWLMMIVAGPLVAQTLRNDMSRVQEYFATQRVQFRLQYAMFASHAESGEPIQRMEARYYLWDEMYSYKTDELYLLTNHKMMLSVDHDQKLVMINKHDPGDKRRRLKELTELFTDSLRSRVVSDSLLAGTSSGRTWRMQFKTPVKGIDHIDVTIALPEGRIEKMTYYYASTFQELYEDAPDGVSRQSKPRLEISFLDYSPLTESDKNKYFTGEEVVKLDSKGNATLSATYKTYKLSNYYNLKK